MTTPQAVMAPPTVRRPDRHQTPIRALRVPDEVWHAVKQKAADQGETVTAVILRFLDGYLDEVTSGADEPIGYELTEAGWAAAGTAVSTLTAREAAEVLRVSQTHVCRLAKRGAVDAVMVDGGWLLNRASVDAYRRRTPRPVRSAGPRRPVERRRRLPAGPLLRQVELRGGKAAVGARRDSAERALLERAEASGYLSLWAADRLAVELLGLTLWELWSAEDLV